MHPQLFNRRWNLLLALPILACHAIAWGDDPASPPQYGNWTIGHQILSTTPESGTHRPMDIHVWFPTGPDVSKLEPANYGRLRARFAYETDQAASEGGFPLIVYSPGWGSDATTNSVFAESMVSHGFVVASARYPDSSVEQSASDRPLDVSSIIDVMLANNATEGHSFKNLIDEEAIGVAGFSIGGFTAMASVAGITTGRATVPPDERIRAIMPIAKAIPSDPGLEVDKVDVPTLLFAGKQDSASGTARSDLPRLSSTAKYAVIVDGANHLDVGVTRCQQSPPETVCSNDETLRLQSLYGVSFFNQYLKGDPSFSHVLTQSYAARNEPTAEFWATGVADTDRDGRTTFADFLFLAEYFGQSGKLGSGRRADFNRDRAVDFADFLILAINFSGDSQGAAAAAVPEPAGYSTLLVGIVAALGRRRRSRKSRYCQA